MNELVLTAVWLWLALPMQASSPAAQQKPAPELPTCVPIAKRVGEVGCWIILDEPVGRLPQEPVFWHLDTFPTRAAAEAAKRPGAAVIEAQGKVWLMTIDSAQFRAGAGEHVTRIGPLPTSPTIEYSAMYMEAVFMPGMESSTHTHSGPEAWYTIAGETCLETPEGRMVGRAGGPPVIVPAGPPMRLTATGSSTRRAIVLILHDRTQPATTVTHAWTPKGLCRER
jgi:quercetin dioxygenase-like cupin family protein